VSEHALWSPSAAAKNMSCPGALAMEQGIADQESEFAAEGTCAHTIAAECLTAGTDAIEHLGRLVKVGQFEFTVDEDMCEHVQTYLDQVRAKVEQFKLRGAKSVELLVEVRVNFSKYSGIPDSFGTSDVVLLVVWPGEYDEVHVADLKFGRGVQVFAEKNKQMMHYALGAYDQFAVLGDFGKFSMAIHQPRINHHDEWECDLDYLLNFGDDIKHAAAQAFEVIQIKKDGGDITPYLNPTPEGCMWCRAKAACPALAAYVAKTVFDDFAAFNTPYVAKTVFDDFTAFDTPELPVIEVQHDPSVLARKMAATGLIEDWIKAVRAACEAELFAGRTVPGYKLVMGKQGNRAWEDQAAAEAKLKHMRVRQEDMYSFKLLGPPAIEKLMKKTPKRWAQVVGMIKRRAAVPSVAPEADKRPAIAVDKAEDDFENLEGV
jgi:hypothetical protein